MNTDQTAQQGGELAWCKSSYSSGEGGECVEIAVALRKSSHSAGDGGGALPHAIHVRDSKDTTRPALMVGAFAWTAFVGFATR
ncbi:hypothetical protein AMK16_06630 [Streptomyces sp. CB00455]|uniref:DUF397 domain-containing protein n=1 Tax=Streptomyces sp. CB00455 TaxID=1703927 RepID=UPI000939A529|nr:DUF397 domain-containing protein [Streptomyces sp. CB00455]OKK22732.1 hypothetical protein AMK16_06630 [Streptomyces sp. CB00455]